MGPTLYRMALISFILFSLAMDGDGKDKIERKRQKNRKDNRKGTPLPPMPRSPGSEATTEVILVAGGRARGHEVERNWTNELPTVMYLEDYPNPQVNLHRCGRNGKRSYVCDPGHVISNTKADELDRLINVTCSKTKCACSACSSPWFQHDAKAVCHGYSIAVAIVTRVDFGEPSNLSGDEAEARQMERWASSLRRSSWGFGNCDDNVVIVLDNHTGKVKTSVGEKAHEVLKAECIKEIHKNAMQQSGDKQLLLKSIVEKYSEAFISGACYVPNEPGLHPAAIAVIALFSAFTIVILIAAACCVWGTCRKDVPSKNRDISNDRRTFDPSSMDSASEPIRGGLSVKQEAETMANQRQRGKSLARDYHDEDYDHYGRDVRYDDEGNCHDYHEYKDEHNNEYDPYGHKCGQDDDAHEMQYLSKPACSHKAHRAHLNNSAEPSNVHCDSPGSSGKNCGRSK